MGAASVGLRYRTSHGKCCQEKEIRKDKQIRKGDGL